MEKCIPMSCNHLIPMQKFKYSPLKLASAELAAIKKFEIEESNKDQSNLHLDILRNKLENTKKCEKMPKIFDNSQLKRDNKYLFKMNNISESFKYLNKSINHLNNKIENPILFGENEYRDIEDKGMHHVEFNKLKEKKTKAKIKRSHNYNSNNKSISVSSDIDLQKFLPFKSTKLLMKNLILPSFGLQKKSNASNLHLSYISSARNVLNQYEYTNKNNEIKKSEPVMEFPKLQENKLFSLKDSRDYYKKILNKLQFQKLHKNSYSSAIENIELINYKIQKESSRM